MRTAKRVKSEFRHSLLHNNWSVLLEITVTVLLNDDLTCLSLKVRGKPLTSGTEAWRGWENTPLWGF